MERELAVQKLRELVGTDLRPLAEQYQVTVWKGDKKNKGWAGHVLERHLGLPINSSQSPNFGSWELKVVPLKLNRSGELRVKETMAITMIDEYHVLRTPFEESHLYAKLRKAVVCAREFHGLDETRARLISVGTFDLTRPDTLAQVKADYEIVQTTIRDRGFSALSGSLGVLVQPRTKGPGHGSTTRAFYARAQFVAHILGFEQQ
jgi:DNA mismatch repair protein MutH